LSAHTAGLRARPCARETREASRGAARVDEEHPVTDPKTRWPASRIITMAILLALLALVIYLKATGVV
jgi:hypothetical protein